VCGDGSYQRFHRGFTAAEKTELWDRWKRGESLKAIGRAFGRPSSSIYFLVAPHGGIRPGLRRRSRLALAGQNDLGALEYFGPWNRRRSSMVSIPTYNFGKLTFVRIRFTTGNGIAYKVLICGNPTVSADRCSWWRLWRRCSTVGPNQIGDRSRTAFRLVFAFALPTAHPRHGADHGPRAIVSFSVSKPLLSADRQRNLRDPGNLRWRDRCIERWRKAKRLRR